MVGTGVKLAIVGAGISGLTAAYRLAPFHEVDVFESNAYLGGHTNTIDVDDDGETSTISGTDEDGETFEMTTGTDIPDAWPSDIPLPPGTITSATAMSDNTDQILNISSEVSDAQVHLLETVAFFGSVVGKI